jgi:hypothetical protein
VRAEHRGTIGVAGQPEFLALNPRGLRRSEPTGTPEPVIARLRAVAASVAKDADMVSTIGKAGMWSRGYGADTPGDVELRRIAMRFPGAMRIGKLPVVSGQVVDQGLPLV